MKEDLRRETYRTAVGGDRGPDREELRERFEAFKRRDLYGIQLVALFLDATYLAVRPEGPKEGVPVA